MTEKVYSSPSGPKARYRADVSLGGATVGTLSVLVMTCTITGARVTDLVTMCTKTTHTANLVLCGPWVSLADTVTFYLVNPTGAPIASGALSLAFEVLTSPVTSA